MTCYQFPPVNCWLAKSTCCSWCLLWWRSAAVTCCGQSQSPSVDSFSCSDLCGNILLHVIDIGHDMRRSCWLWSGLWEYNKHKLHSKLITKKQHKKNNYIQLHKNYDKDFLWYQYYHYVKIHLGLFLSRRSSISVSVEASRTLNDVALISWSEVICCLLPVVASLVLKVPRERGRVVTWSATGACDTVTGLMTILIDFDCSPMIRASGKLECVGGWIIYM